MRLARSNGTRPALAIYYSRLLNINFRLKKCSGQSRYGRYGSYATAYLPAKIPGGWYKFTYHAVDSILVGCVVIPFSTSFIPLPWGW